MKFSELKVLEEFTGKGFSDRSVKIADDLYIQMEEEYGYPMKELFGANPEVTQINKKACSSCVHKAEGEDYCHKLDIWIGESLDHPLEALHQNIKEFHCSEYLRKEG